jgi:poly(hydroxyalkanoate) granule-associated protein
MTNPPDNGSSTPDFSAIKDSAQQIWQAGLGAFTRAQAEGSKAFEALVREGVEMQRKSQVAAEEKLAEASARMNTIASELSAKASGQWDKLETIFEERVGKALDRLGVPTTKDIDALSARIDDLTLAIQKLASKGSVTGKASVSARPRAAAKSGAAKPRTPGKTTLRRSAPVKK